MARPREVRGWVVYGIGVAIAFLMLAFRLYYGTGGATSPFLLISWVDVPLLIGILAGAVAALGLHQALWYFLVKPGGWALFAGSFLMFVVASLFFYALPAHLAEPTFFFLMFFASLVLFLYVPTLSYGSRAWLGIASAGDAGLIAASLYGPMQGLIPLTNVIVLATLAAQGVLLIALLRLLQLAFKSSRAAATA